MLYVYNSHKDGVSEWMLLLVPAHTGRPG